MRKTILPQELFGEFHAGCHLTRNGIVRVCTDLHDELPRQYPRIRHLRHPEDERLCSYFLAIADGDTMHTFEFFVDDCISPDHLLVAGFEHYSRRR